MGTVRRHQITLVSDGLISVDGSPWARVTDETPYGQQGLTFGDFRAARNALSPQVTG